MSIGLSRRAFVGMAGLATLGRTWSSTSFVYADDKPKTALTADEALQDLLEGNARFAAGKPASPRRSPRDFAAVAESQAPEAVIITCADSRVPPEILFDQGVGDLFVIRVAGNVVHGTGSVVKGSIEYAIAELKVPLIMVLGHSGCGAVKAAQQHLHNHDALPGALNELVNLIKPAVERSQKEAGDKLENAIRANVELGVERLSTLEPVLAGPVKAGSVKIVGATYDLRSGQVKLFA